MSCYNIMSILVSKRFDSVDKIQAILTKYGFIIKVRLGLHDLSGTEHDNGLIILQLNGTEEDIKSLMQEISQVKGTDVQMISHCPI